MGADDGRGLVYKALADVVGNVGRNEGRGDSRCPGGLSTGK